VLLAGLSTGNKIGLAVVAAIFITFALVSSLVVPKRNPEYPGKNGLSVFIIVTILLFLSMVTAVVVFGVESEAKGAAESTTTSAVRGGKAVAVSETEFKITLASSTVPAGKITFHVKNAGKIQHDLAVSGPGVNGIEKTPLIAPGGVATLSVTLGPGSFTLFCTVPGHRAAGMVTKLTVG
jgi:uncharacterized cupredoxin-like copper-binding protein